MGWVRQALNWGNPTQSWIAEPFKLLVLCLDDHQLCGVGIGDRVDSLSFLGPAARWSGTLDFPDHGLSILQSQGIDEMTFFFGHPSEPEAGTFRGTILHRGATVPLSSADDEQTIVRQFGEPYWRDADVDETILFYEFGSHEWQVEFGPDGRLKCLSIACPLLADPVQREAYGVSKPWPPT
jgi:hypothetical protein